MSTPHTPPVIPAKAGIQDSSTQPASALDSSLRWNDKTKPPKLP